MMKSVLLPIVAVLLMAFSLTAQNYNYTVRDSQDNVIENAGDLTEGDTYTVTITGGNPFGECDLTVTDHQGCTDDLTEEGDFDVNGEKTFTFVMPEYPDWGVVAYVSVNGDTEGQSFTVSQCPSQRVAA